MTREEAIQKIQNDLKLHHDYLSGDYRKALRMAIEALQQSEIVRCKDCRYLVKGQDADTHDYFHHCNYWQADTVPDGFCHEAEEEGEAE